MVTIRGRYEGELRCTSVHDRSSAELATDAPLDNHGKGESFSPTDLVATALATCMLTTMAIVAERNGLSINGATYVATKEMATEPPRRIARIAVRIAVPVVIDAASRERLEAAAHKCPVHHTLHESVRCDVSFEWAAAEAEADVASAATEVSRPPA